MLTLRARRWRATAGLLAALLAAPAVVIGSASAAQADVVRQQELWVLNAIHVTGAWQRTHGSGVTVGLIDSGVNGQVSDLTGSVLTGRDFSGVNTPPTDPNWGMHGTWMASLIAGHGHPPGGSSGIMGVAPAAKILSIRAVTDQGDPGYHRYQRESESRVQGHLAAAIRYATSKRVNVISMSLGYQGASLPVRVAISDAVARGIVVVASSGNSGGTTTSVQHGNAPYSFPADYLGVLGVGAVGQSGRPAGFSSNNLSVQVAAPGVRVPAQGRDGQYWLVSGTSPACALTAGVAALIKSVYPALAPALVVQAITATATHKPSGGYDERVGFGTVDATAALTMAGRLAHDQDAGRGQVATARFGGGTAAIPAIPVTPRSRRQLLVDSLLALACLAVVLVVVFRLIAARRPAVARPVAGWAPSSGGSGWAGLGAPGGRAGPGAPDGLARVSGPGVPGPGAPGPGAPGPGAPGPGVVGAGAGTGSAGPRGASSGGGEPGYGRSGGYWAPGGYKPSGGSRPSAGYEPSPGFQPPPSPRPSAGVGPAASPRPPADVGPAASPRPSAGAGPPVAPGPSAGAGPPADPRLPADPRQSAEAGAAVGYQRPEGSLPPRGAGPPSGSLPPSGSVPLGGYGRPSGSGSPAGYRAPAGYEPPADSGPPTEPERVTEPGPATGYGAPPGQTPDGDGQGAGHPPTTWGSPTTAYGLSAGNGPPPAGNGPPTGYQQFPGHTVGPDGAGDATARPAEAAARPADAGARPADAGARPADAEAGPLAGPTEPPDSQAGRAGGPPAADDDTWPSSRPW